MRLILRSAWKILVSMFGVFFITFTVFPGAFFASKFYFLDPIAGAKGESEEVTWYQIMVILLFNIFDTVGRFLGGKLNISHKMTINLGLLRLVFVPLTILIGLKNPVQLDQDWLKLINLILFALSNGLVSTLCAIKAPQFVREDLREKVGIFISLFLGCGLLTGSLSAMLVGLIQFPA